MSSSISQNDTYDISPPMKRKKNPPIRDFPYWILKELLLKKNKKKERSILTTTAEKVQTAFQNSPMHTGIWYEYQQGKKKNRFQVFIAEVASVNKVFIGKSDWTAMALKAISESTEQCKSLRSR